MTDKDDTDTRKIEKRRSWKEISTSAFSTDDPSTDDYAIELALFERGDIDKSLWAKHLVEAKGDENEAKWLYVKERVVTAPARRAEQEKARKEAEKRAFAEEQRRKKQRAEAERKAAEEAERKAAKEAERKAAEEAKRKRLEAEIAERKAAREAAEEAERKAAEEAKRKAAEEAEEAERKAAEEAKRKAAEEAEAMLEPIRQARVKKYEEKERAGLAVKPKGAGCFWVLFALVAIVLLINLISSEPSPSGQSSPVPHQKSEIGSAISESWLNFVGQTGAVDEVAALEKVKLAIEMLDGAKFPEADDYAGVAYNNLGVIYACSVDGRVRDKQLSKSAYAQVANMESAFIDQAMWNVFWGGSLADSVNTPEQYNFVDDLMSDWAPLQFRERYPEKTPLEVLKLMDEKRSEVPLPEHIAAQQIAYYFECRAESQNIGLAIEWHQTALERLSVTPEPIVSSTDLPLDEELQTVLTDLSLAGWEWDKQRANERLIRLQQAVADYRR